MKANSLKFFALAVLLTGCVSSPPAPKRAIPAPPKVEMPRAEDPRCDPIWSAAYNAPIPEGRLDPKLLDQALLAEVNRVRCDAGLPSLTADPAITRAAINHADDMARLRLLRHVGGPIETLTDRLDAANADYGYAGENLFRYQRYAIDPARPIYTLDARACVFSYVWKGPAIPVHTYRTLASALMEGWVRSPAHAKNIFNPNFRRVGAGAAVQRDTPQCGDVFAAQIFAG